jgi:alpha-tubulin suppressor-like RCC1 family protein
MAITRTKIGNLWFNYRGDYDNAATYKKDDIVIWNNTDYLNVREANVSGKRPQQNTQYYYNIQATTDPNDSTTKFQIDADITSTIEWAQTLYVRRGDKIVFYQNNNNNDDQPLALATSATSQTSNYLTTGVTYYHNEEMVSQADFVNTSKFNTKTSRKVVVDFNKDTPDEIWYFSAGTGGANYGGKIVVADWDTWRPLRNSFSWKGLHVLTSGTTYYENDVVQVRHGISNDMGTDYEGQSKKETLSTYICLRQHTTDGTERFLPYNRNVDTDGNMYWLKMGAEYESDDERYEQNGVIESVDSVSAADASRLHGVFRNVSPKSTSNSAVNAHPGCFKITVQGNGSILDTDTFSAADALRTAGTYTNVSQSATTGVGTGAVFNVTVDSTGAVSNLEIIKTRNKSTTPTGGSGYINNETITIADASLGGGGGADFTFQANGVGVAGQATIEVERVSFDSKRDQRWFNDTGMISGGENNVINDTLTFDGDIFGGGADLTCDVASLRKQTRGASTLFSGNSHECMSLINNGPIGDDNKYYRLSGQRTSRHCVNWPVFLGGTGNIWTWGSNSTGQNGFNHSFMTATQMSFNHYDWWRSTDNGGTGVHTTPDGEVPKVIQIEGGYESGMCLMNSGEVYHWGYGGHGQNGDASTSNRDHPVRVGGSNQNVYLAANDSAHVFRSVRIKRIFLSNWQGYNSSTHSCYAIDEAGELWSWGYNGYGQLGTGNTTNYNTPQKIAKTNFNNEEIEAFWTIGDAYASAYAYTKEKKLYVWGRNADGQLGIGNTTDQNTPQLVSTVTFDGTGVGEIKKFQGLNHSDDNTVAILTERGTIYTTGYNNQGHMGNGNTTALNTWTICSNGTGNAANADCNNFWMTGNGAHAQMWIEDSLGNIQCAGYNNHGSLGNGNDTTQNSFVTPKFQLGSDTEREFHNVKLVAGFPHYNDLSTKILTWDGHVFQCGDNRYGQSSNGWSSTNSTNDRNAENLKEHFQGYHFNQVRFPMSLTGNVEDMRGCGYGDNADAVYAFWEYKSFDNRYYLNGYGGSYMQGNADSELYCTAHVPILG